MLVFLAVALGCAGAPKGAVSSVAVVTEGADQGKLSVEWGLFQPNGDATVGGDGELTLEIVEREVDVVPSASDAALCSEKLAVDAGSFRRDHDWTVASTMQLTDGCAVQLEDVGRWRVLRLTFTGPEGTFSTEVDPPKSVQTPTTMSSAVPLFRKRLDDRVISEPDSVTAEAAAVGPKLTAYAATWAALAPLVPAEAGEPGGCSERGRPVPLIEYEDLETAAGTFDPAAKRRLMPPGFLAQLVGGSGELSAADIVFAGRMVDDSIDRVWVRRSTSFTDVSELAGAEGAEVQLHYTGVLALVGRLPPRLLCAAGMTRSSTKAAIGPDATEARKVAFAKLAGEGVEHLAFAASHETRQKLVGDQLRFLEAEGRVRQDVDRKVSPPTVP